MTDTPTPPPPPSRGAPARAVENVVEVGAPVDDVWRAITTAEGLTQFMCDHATVVPGAGGSVQIGWHVGDLPPSRIEAWEPGARLRLVYEPDGDDGVTTAEDWTLRADGDHTVVRLVFEGFGPGDDWDEFYDRFDATGGLILELLAAWLGPGRGAPLAKAWVHVTVPGDIPSAQAAVLGPTLAPAPAGPGPAGAGTLPAVGDPVSVALPGGPPLDGTLALRKDDEVAVALPGGARLVVTARPGPAPGTSRALVEAYAWGIDDEALAASQARLDAAAAALSPTDTSPTPDTRPDQEAPVPDSHIPADNHAVTPYICCKGAAEAIDFYVEVFGATEAGSRFVDGEGRVGHAELRFGDSLVYLSDEHPDIGVVAPDPAAAAVGLVLYVPDVDEAVARAESRGSRVVQAIEETFYGTRRATLIDPFGHRWMVGTHVRDVSEDEYQAAVDGFAAS